jgi:DNA-binding transcriptional regulator PaaX
MQKTNPFDIYKKTVKKRKRRERFGNLTKDILVTLGAGAILFFVLSSPQGARKLFKGFKAEWNPKTTRLSLEKLRTKKLVSFKENPDGSFSVLLTEEGQFKAREWELETLQIEPPRRWDGKWRIVAFDISEKRVKARKALHEMLKRLNFHQLQKSVFVHPYPCEAEIELIRDVFYIPPQEIICFIAETIPDIRALKEKYNL